MTRSREKASQLLGEKDGLEVIVADAKDPQSLPAAVQGIDAVAAVTGTTAFPSKKCVPQNLLIWYWSTLLNITYVALHDSTA